MQGKGDDQQRDAYQPAFGSGQNAFWPSGGHTHGQGERCAAECQTIRDAAGRAIGNDGPGRGDQQQ